MPNVPHYIHALILPEAGSPVPLMRPLPQAIEGASKVVESFMMFGGMDTEGVIFDDTLLFLLPSDTPNVAGAANV